MAAQEYQITMRSGPTPGKTFSIEQEENVLGRDLANDIAISDPEVSRRHARFMIREGSVFVEDLGSTNGTFLNGERISSPLQLRSGDVLTLGESIVLIFSKISYDPDATVVSSQGEPEGDPTIQQWAPEQQAYQPPPDPAELKQTPPLGSDIHIPRRPEPMRDEVIEKKGGFPTWLIILIIAIVVIICIIAVTLYFMPASWWCAIDIFGMIEACPLT